MLWESAGFLATAAFPAAALADAGAEPSMDRFLPFVRSPVANARREVFAHWHFFAISMDNRPSSGDYYAVNFLNPKNSSGKDRDFGSLLRERPLPRPPRDTSAWAVADMERDIRWALEIGVDAFLYNVITIDPNSPFWQVLVYMLDAAAKVDSAFRIVPNLDATLLAGQPVASIAAALKSISSHPMLLRRDGGQLVLGAFSAETWPARNWVELFDDLAKSGIRVEFMPTFLNVRNATADHWKLA